MKPSEVNLFIGTPCAGSMTAACYTASLLDSTHWLAAHGVRHTVRFVAGEGPISRARNVLVARMMAAGDFTHLLFIDADVAWPPEAIGQLLAADRDVVMGVYPRKEIPTQYPMNVRLIDGQPVQDGPFVELDGGPAGFLLIARRVFPRMFAAYPELKCSVSDNLTPEEEVHSYALFDFNIRDRRYWAEDLTFCHRWQAIGGRVWMDPRIEFGHFGAHLFTGCVDRDFRS